MIAKYLSRVLQDAWPKGIPVDAYPAALELLAAELAVLLTGRRASWLDAEPGEEPAPQPQ